MQFDIARSRKRMTDARFTNGCSKILIGLLLNLSLLLAVSPSDAAPTNVSGNITANTTWTKAVELCREYNISDARFYKWKAKFGGREVSEAKRLRQLEDEKRRLKHMVSDQALDIQALKTVFEKSSKAQSEA